MRLIELLNHVNGAEVQQEVEASHLKQKEPKRS